ncbi:MULTISPECIES: TomO hydrophobic C-terminal domain-containing protein [unclassified Wolbachia]|nr:hypothetical protein [Wolbachia endosymbiont of Psylliodes chrysocephala]
MLAVGVAVAVCCLAVAAIIYLCSGLSSSLDKKQSSCEAINNQWTLST